MSIGKVAVRHLEAVKKTGAFSDGLLALVDCGIHQSEVAKAFGLTRRHLERHCHAGRVRAALREIDCPLTEIGIAPYALVRVGDAQKIKSAVAGGSSLRDAIGQVNNTGFGLYEKPSDVFAAFADDPPPAVKLLTLAVATLAFDTDIAVLHKWGRALQEAENGLGLIIAHLLANPTPLEGN